MQNIVKKNQFTVSPITPIDKKTEKYTAWQTLRDSGMPVSEIARMFDVHVSTIYVNTTTTNLNTRIEAVRAAHRRIFEERKAYYIPLMLELRKLGYTNREIGEKTGFGFMTVYRYIGKQPDETSLASRRAAGAKRHFRHLSIKNQTARDNDEPIPAVAEVLKTA